MVQVSVAESYKRLGLSSGTSLDEVKSAYRKNALRHHPDKNPGDATATQKFQSLSEAYNVLLKHLDHSSQPPPRGPSGFGGPFGFSSPFGGGFDCHCQHHHHDDGEYGYGSDDDFYYDDYSDDDSEFMEAFSRFLFEEVLRGRASRYAGRQFHSMHPNMGHSRYEHETDEQRRERLRRAREKHDAEVRRREEEEANRKFREQQDRLHEMYEATERRKSKAKTKKADKANAQANIAASKASAASRAQQLRSETFAAARAGDATRVKKGVWENNVDAAGPERIGAKAGETLLHIAASRGDVALVQWLDEHNAEVEDRDAAGYTAFHVALDRGITSVVNYFLNAHDPEDSREAYLPTPRETSLLAMAIPDPQLVRILLESGLLREGAKKNVEAAKEACGEPGCTSEIRTMLAKWAGFSLADLSHDDEPSSPDGVSEGYVYQTPETSVEPESPVSTRSMPSPLRGKAKSGNRRSTLPKSASPTVVPTSPAAVAGGTPLFRGGNSRGRGRGVSRGRGQ